MRFSPVTTLSPLTRVMIHILSSLCLLYVLAKWNFHLLQHSTINQSDDTHTIFTLSSLCSSQMRFSPVTTLSPLTRVMIHILCSLCLLYVLAKWNFHLLQHSTINQSDDTHTIFTLSSLCSSQMRFSPVTTLSPVTRVMIHILSSLCLLYVVAK